MLARLILSFRAARLRLPRLDDIYKENERLCIHGAIRQFDLTECRLHRKLSSKTEACVNPTQITRSAVGVALHAQPSPTAFSSGSGDW